MLELPSSRQEGERSAGLTAKWARRSKEASLNESDVFKEQAFLASYREVMSLTYVNNPCIKLLR
ncbi:MAG: hypothetical protein CM1200mP28_05900 [Deltaproteobacteria bacterium]|nr:MAG: hypothetical protein CM1200mP28_05900 [Deltaproteobacteria bacterium]